MDKQNHILYLIRSEADLERIVSIAMAGKPHAKQSFIFFGDSSPIFDIGIKNEFQKHLLKEHDFQVLEAVTLSVTGQLYKLLNQIETSNKLLLLAIGLLSKLLFRIIFKSQHKLAERVLRRMKPDSLITDNSGERDNYFPHFLRQLALKQGVKVHVTGHGPAGGLHKEYYSYEENPVTPFEGSSVGICSIHDFGYGLPNRQLTGDPADSYPHVIQKHALSYGDIDFMSEKKYKIGFFMAAPFDTCTNSWSVMEEIMLDYAGREDVAMIAKFHPRLYKHGDYRYLLKINNLKLYGSELDRSRLVKWADIVVCSDHCSTIFEPMILGKKVVAIHSKKVRQYAKLVSPIHDSDPTINSIHHSNEFDLESLSNYNKNAKFIDEYCWGGNGHSDLGINILRKLIKDID